MVVTIDVIVDTDMKFVNKVDQRLNCPICKKHHVDIDFVGIVWNVF